MSKNPSSLYQLYAICLSLTLALQALIVLACYAQDINATNILSSCFVPLLLLTRSDTPPELFFQLAFIPLAFVATPLLPNRFLGPVSTLIRITSAMIGILAWCFTGMLIFGIDC